MSLRRHIGPLFPPAMLALLPLPPLFELNQTDIELSLIWMPVEAASLAIYGLCLLALRDGLGRA